MLVLANAVLGIALFELAYSQIAPRIKDGNEERDKIYPVFRRMDTKKWSRLNFYPGAIFLPFRLAFLILDCSILAILLKLVTFNYDFKDGPIKNGLRKTIIMYLVQANAYIFVFMTGHYSEK